MKASVKLLGERKKEKKGEGEKKERGEGREGRGRKNKAQYLIT